MRYTWTCDRSLNRRNWRTRERRTRGDVIYDRFTDVSLFRDITIITGTITKP